MRTFNYPMTNTPYSGIGSPCLTSLTHVQACDHPNWSFYMHAHENALEISYILEGRGSLYCGGKNYELSPGILVVKNPNIQHAENSDPKKPIEQVCLLIKGLKLPEEQENVLPTGSFSPIIKMSVHRQLLDALTRDMLMAADMPGVCDISYMNSLLCMIIQAIINEASHSSTLCETDGNEATFDEIRLWIDRHYSEDPSLDAISEQFHISIYHLARQFKRHTGFTVNQYLMSCRIGEAQRRLIFTDSRIDDLAKICGFRNLSYFYTAFRKKVGCTPTEYKKMYSTPERQWK